MRTHYLIFIAALVFNNALMAETGVTKIPLDAENVISRKSSCDHWRGEDGYNEDRKKEIANALRDGKCDTLDADLKNIKRKYKRNGAVLKAVENAGSEG